ncbi:hypothetical protein K1719_026255 [Acacia pycnantha]|nr:hypothetical protein K1719_026255 [Acacia pycnantha]
MEKKSKTGLLARLSRSQPSDTTSASFDPHTMLTHPEVRTTYFRLVSMLGQEMLALQDRLTTSPNNQPSSNGECEEDDDERDEEDDDKEIDEDEDDEKEIEDEDDDNDKEKEKDDQDDEKEIEDEDDEKDKEDEDDHIVDIDDEDSHLHDTPIVQHGLHVEPIEEYCVKISLDRSKPQDEGKEAYDEKEQLYELCTTKSIPKDEAEEEFVDMNGLHLQRVELLCLRPLIMYYHFVHIRVMTMIAKTLVADQLDNGGTVTQHIFSPHFMEKMIEDPMNWPLEANKAEILPDRIGYNIGDCHFIFGPSLRWDHWFYYVLDTTTMTFYALDSIPKGVTWSKVHVQTDVDSCGVHVVSWLQM